MRQLLRRLTRDRRGSAAVEFAVVGTLLFTVSLGGMELGLILWTQGALQSIAADAARCGAISATGCTSNSGIQSFVQTEAQNWTMNGVATNLNVYVNGSVNTTSCPAITVGSFETVEITTSYLSGWLPPPFHNYKIDVCASYAS